MTRLRRPARLIALLTALFLLVASTACSPAITTKSAANQRNDTAVPAINDVTTIPDARDYDGPIQLQLPDPAIDPVDEDPTSTLPATVTDAQGTKVTVTDTSRILALDIYGTIATTVYQLGLGKNVVGRDVSSQFPEIRDRPLVTSTGHELNAEAILALDPSVILTDTSLGPWDVILQMRDLDIPVVVVDSKRSLENLSSLTQQIADALGVSESGKLLSAQIQRHTDAKVAEIKAVTPTELSAKPRMIFLYVRGQSGIYYMFGQGSGADSLIQAIGGYDVTRELGWKGMKPVNDEALIAAQPDAIVMMNKGLDSVGGVDGLLEKFPALANTAAGEHKRIIAMNDDQILSFGPRTPDVLNALAVALYAPNAL